MDTVDYQPIGLDALELSAPRDVNFTPEFDREWRKSFTRGVGADDLRKLGLPVVMIHPHSRSGKKGVRTLQFKNLGSMDASAIHATAAQILDTEPLELRSRRLDFTADLRRGPTMSQIRACLQVRKKRKYVEYINPNRSGGMYETQRHDGGQLETLYYGDLKTDCLRIYDKAAQIAKEKRRPRNSCTDSWLRFERVLVHDCDTRPPEHARKTPRMRP